MKNKIKLVYQSFNVFLKYVFAVIHDAKHYYYSSLYPFRYDPKRMEGKIIKLTHSMEKRLSFENTDPSFGQKKAFNLLGLIEKHHSAKVVDEEILSWALCTLESFTDKFIPEPDKKGFLNRVHALRKHYGVLNNGGYFTVTKEDVASSITKPFDVFLANRHSIRSFSGLADVEKIKKAVTLSTKCPSTCNIQPVRVHLIQNKTVLNNVLDLQRGNRGFRDQIHQLLVVTTELSLYGGVRERNQSYIDAGIFSATLAYSLHFNGIGSCFLNWAATPREDNIMHKTLNLPKSHKVVVLLAVGALPQKINIACSHRRDSKQVLKII